MPRPRNLPTRFWIQSALAAVTAILLVTTLISREWIELLTGFDPDHGSGGLEWAIVGVLAIATIALTWSARLGWRASVADSA